VLEQGKRLALAHNLSLTHVDLATASRREKACRRADRVCRELYQHTSANGLFVVVLAGGLENNAAVGVTLCAPPPDDSGWLIIKIIKKICFAIFRNKIVQAMSHTELGNFEAMLGRLVGIFKNNFFLRFIFLFLFSLWYMNFEFLFE
jgi:hypothetical protein